VPSIETRRFVERTRCLLASTPFSAKSTNRKERWYVQADTSRTGKHFRHTRWHGGGGRLLRCQAHCFRVAAVRPVLRTDSLSALPAVHVGSGRQRRWLVRVVSWMPSPYRFVSERLARNGVVMTSALYRYCSASHDTDVAIADKQECPACPGVTLERGRCACCGAEWSTRDGVWTLETSGRLQCEVRPLVVVNKR
jgi:hypothetical protein